MNSTTVSHRPRLATALVLLAVFTLWQVLCPIQASAGNKNNSPAGTVTTWGEGSFQPRLVTFPAGTTPISISAYEYAGGLAIAQDGRLFDWFGVGGISGVEVLFPAPVTSVSAASRRFSHTLALTDDGLYAWGGNDKGQLGDGTMIDHSTPEKVQFPAGVTVLGIAAGYSHSLAITDDGLYAWGDNFNGELGDGTRINRSLPVKVALPFGATTVFQVAAGRNTSYAITSGGLYAWGSDFAGQLGNGSFGTLPDGSTDAGKTLPVKVIFNRKVTSVLDIAAGEYYALAITDDGLYAWGMNLSGCLGAVTGTTALPVKVVFPKAVTTVKAIAATTSHSFAITDDGLYAWGSNAYGQLGISGSDRLTPAKVPGEGNAIDIAAAEYSSIALH